MAAIYNTLICIILFSNGILCMEIPISNDPVYENINNPSLASINWEEFTHSPQARAVIDGEPSKSLQTNEEIRSKYPATPRVRSSLREAGKLLTGLFPYSFTDWSKPLSFLKKALIYKSALKVDFCVLENVDETIYDTSFLLFTTLSIQKLTTTLTSITLATTVPLITLAESTTYVETTTHEVPSTTTSTTVTTLPRETGSTSTLIMVTTLEVISETSTLPTLTLTTCTTSLSILTLTDTNTLPAVTITSYVYTVTETSSASTTETVLVNAITTTLSVTQTSTSTSYTFTTTHTSTVYSTTVTRNCDDIRVFRRPISQTAMPVETNTVRINRLF